MSSICILVVFILFQLFEFVFQLHHIHNEYFARTATCSRTYNTGRFELVHESAGTIVTNRVSALQ